MGFIFVLLIVYVVILAILYIETKIIERNQKTLSLRIGVTGTRGKSSTVRMIASILREQGIRTLAKTTGSAACYVLPNGKEEPVKRIGLTSILEQKKVLKKAVDLNCSALVCEVMGVDAQYMEVESKKILAFNHYVVTNTRVDHPEHGKSRDSVASSFVQSFPKNSKIYIQSDETDLYGNEIDNPNLIIVEPSDVQDFPADSVFLTKNLNAVLAVAQHLGLDTKDIVSTINKTQLDVGALTKWEIENTLFVSAFATNDVDSTKLIIDSLPLCDGRFIIFNTRADRPWRTQQLSSAIVKGVFGTIKIVFVIGDHSLYSKSILEKGNITVHHIKAKEPKDIHQSITSELQNNEMNQVIGIGNIAHVASDLIKYWNSIGKKDEL